MEGCEGITPRKLVERGFGFSVDVGVSVSVSVSGG
jgi:hypothetical protein